MIMNNSGDKITVRGTDSYGADWLRKSGVINVADVRGEGSEVSMEQLYTLESRYYLPVQGYFPPWIT